MLYIIVEKFHPGRVTALYEKFDREGRLLPEGVEYLDSWVTKDLTICYQVMKSDRLEKLEDWVRRWDTFADFEIIPVLTSVEAKTMILKSNRDE